MTRRLGRALLASLALATSSFLIAACGGPTADTYAHQACLSVHSSILLFDKSRSATTSSERASLAAQALSMLRSALRPAALAGGGGGQWEPLEMTLSQSSTISEATLIPALSAQCAATLQSS